MSKSYFILGILLATAIFISSCDETVPEPAYIYIDNIYFTSDSARGSSSSAITDVWPSVDGQQLGANTFPCIFPVILDPNFSTNSIKISAGIKDNGITNTRTIYPFYVPYITSLKLEPGKIDTFHPTLQYDPTATIIVVEDFEKPNVPIFTTDRDGNPNTVMLHQSTEVFEGNYSGQLVIDSANLDCTVSSSSHFYNLQSSFASPVYIELNYKTNTPFQVGIVAHYSNGSSEITYKGGGNATTGWKKIYFNLTAEVYNSNATEYSLIFRALKYPDVDQPLIYLDNIKLLHY